MTPTETLKHEHTIVVMILEAAEREARAMREGGAVHADEIEKMVDFFKNFVDRCHHAKEERHLFPTLQGRGLPAGSGPIAVMLHEHEQGRAYVRAIAAALPRAAAGNGDAKAGLSDSLLGYGELLRSHIFKEDNVLFPLADQVLTAADQTALAQRFDQVEAEEIGPGVHEEYHQLAHRLAGK